MCELHRVRPAVSFGPVSSQRRRPRPPPPSPRGLPGARLLGGSRSRSRWRSRSPRPICGPLPRLLPVQPGRGGGWAVGKASGRRRHSCQTNRGANEGGARTSVTGEPPSQDSGQRNTSPSVYLHLSLLRSPPRPHRSHPPLPPPLSAANCRPHILPFPFPLPALSSVWLPGCLSLPASPLSPLPARQAP